MLYNICFILTEYHNIPPNINENLEQQAQALFKAWFVDFEPFGGVMPDDWQETTLNENLRLQAA